MKRVVVTGMAGMTSLGSDWDTIAGNFAPTAVAFGAWTSGTGLPN